MRSRLTAWLALPVCLMLLAGCGAGRFEDRIPVEEESVESTTVENEEGEAPREEEGDDQPGSPNPFPAEEQAFDPPTETSWASHRNGALKQGIAASDLPDELVPLWKKEVKYGIPSSSAIVGDHVYVPTLLGFLYCLDKRTGEEVWAYRSVPPETKFAPGMKAPPLVTADTVYTGDEDGVVHAIDRATGEKKWTFAADAEVTSGVTLLGEKGESVLVASQGGMFRLKAETGEVEWAIREIAPIILSPPVVDGLSFALGCEEKVLAVVEVETGKQRAKYPLDAVTLSTPACWKDRIYLATQDGVVQELDFATGEVTWSFTPKRPLSFEGSCAVTEEAVYAAGKNKLLHKLDRKTGEEIWSFATEGQILSSPVVVGNRVFIGSDDQHLYGVDVETGEETFKFNLQGSVKADPVVGEGVLVVSTESNPGAVFCFGAKAEDE